MPPVDVKLYKEFDGAIPVVEWMEDLPPKIIDKIMTRIEALQEYGSELREPHSKQLRDGIFELRVRWQNVNYRILYCFEGPGTAVLLHGLTKEQKVPTTDIQRALIRREKLRQNPKQHIATEDVP